ncbi:MAG: HAMP domain-containing protein [Rhodocyclaceae bacterium]|nr:MAG: HAMP domain-containing protein [Rhodocyclaceae bacterium]
MRLMSRLIPSSLFGRLTLILVVGLLAAQFASMWLHMGERALLMQQSHGHLPDLPSRFGTHLVITLAAVIAVSLVAVRLVTRPLQRLAEAADAFGSDLESPPLEESGPAETRRAAEAFNRMQDRLRRLIAERGRALAAVSHDLRTPLTRMRLRAELVEDESLRAQINGDIDDMQAMVESTLDYLRGLRENEPVQSIDMEALLASLVTDQQALGRPVTLTGSVVAPYLGRLSTLKRALDNLIDNAVKYGQSALIVVEDGATELRLIVEDCGPGIPEADLVRVLDPYVRLDASRSRETGGVGLGLTIARDAAMLHGGKLLLENLAGGGLRATLVLPRSYQINAVR